ncbi:hypothetical protein GYA44_01850 [Candidatus Microgenomates bacterium]|nr:hypothetical protein [Candidatus Microgenomates bacterium]
MDSIKDILSQIQNELPKETNDEGQSKLFDTDKLKTNPKKLFGEKHKYISQEYQAFGLRIAGKLGDKQRMTMYIKWAKEKPRAILEQALSFTSDYPNAKDKIRIFMWKVKQLEDEYKAKKQQNTK